MVDIRPTQTGIVSDTSGLSEGVQVDTSALKDANARKTQLVQNAIEGATAIGQQVVALDAKDKAEQIDAEFWGQGDSASEQAQLEFLQGQGIEGDEEIDSEIADLKKDIERKARLKGQMSKQQYDIMMEVGMKEAINNAPWAEKTIAAMYGQVSGRNKAVLSLLQKQSAESTRAADRKVAFNNSYISKHGLRYTGDPVTDDLTVQKHNQSLAITTNRVMEGSEGGLSGFLDEYDANIDSTKSVLWDIGSRFHDVTDPQLKTDGVNTIIAEGERIKSELHNAYGDSVPAKRYEELNSRIDAMVKLHTDRISDKTTSEEAANTNKLMNAMDTNYLKSNSPAFRTMTAMANAGLGDQTVAQLINSVPEGNRMLTDLLTISTMMINGDHSTASELVLNQSKEDSKKTAKINEAKGQAYVNNPNSEYSQESTVPEEWNETAKMVANGEYGYNKDLYMSIAHVTSGDAFFRLSSEGFKHFDTQALSDFAKVGARDAMDGARNEIFKGGLVDGRPISDFLVLNRTNDGRINVSSRGTDILLSRAGPVQGENLINQINSTADNINRKYLDIFNSAVRTDAHLSGHKNYQDISDQYLTDYGIESIIPIDFDMQEVAPTQAGGIAPGVTAKGGVVTRDQPQTVQQIQSQVDTRFQNPNVNAPQENTFIATAQARNNVSDVLPTTGSDLDVEELHAMVIATPSVDTTAREARVRSFENNKLNPKGGWTGTVWTPHPSLEGGTDTLAYGHKLTNAEDNSKVVRIGNKDVDYTKGITEQEAQQLFQQDWNKAQKGAESLIKKNKLESIPRRAKLLLAEMVYQMGETSVSKFKQMMIALKDGDYTKAANQMRDSKWHKKDSPRRAEILAKEMESLDL